MSTGTNRHYRISEVTGRHFVQSGKSARLGADLMHAAIDDLFSFVPDAAVMAREAMPRDFADYIGGSIADGLMKRLAELSDALNDL